MIIDGIQRIVEGLTEGAKPLKIDPLVLGIIGESLGQRDAAATRCEASCSSI